MNDYVDGFLDAVIATPELDMILDGIEAPVVFADGTYIVENTETLGKTLGLLESFTGEEKSDLLETAVLVGLKMRVALELYGKGFSKKMPIN